MATGKELRRFTGDHFYRSINFMFTADGSLVVSVWSQPATIEPRLAPVLRAWDVATGKEIRKVSLHNGGFVAASQPMHNRQILIGGYFDRIGRPVESGNEQRNSPLRLERRKIPVEVANTISERATNTRGPGKQGR